MTKSDQESFLSKEYDQCFEHMRHYENQTKDLLHFSYGYYSAIAALSIGIYQYFHETQEDSAVSFGYTAILLIFAVVIGTIITIQFVRYRKYYVSTARQVNKYAQIFKILSGYLAFICLAVYVIVLWLRTKSILK